MIRVDESDPVGELDPSFPYRDVTIKRGVDVKEYYDLQEEIGRGKFGTVYRCREKTSGLTLAAKFVGIARRQDRRNVEREVEIMRALQHPRLIQLYDAFETNNVMCVVLELIEGGELFERVIDDDFILTEKACAVFMRQIVEGVEFIHRNNVIHLDLKPENILCLTKTGNRIKIIDFGLARKFDPDKKLQVLFGTPEFVAPEVVNFDQISFATDMWSVGVICYVLLSGLSPFMGETDVETMANVTIAQYDFDDDAFEDISQDAKDFIAKLLVKDQVTRLTAAECLDHPWLRRKVPPPPPKLETSKENLKSYVERIIPSVPVTGIKDIQSKPSADLVQEILVKPVINFNDSQKLDNNNIENENVTNIAPESIVIDKNLVNRMHSQPQKREPSPTIVVSPPIDDITANTTLHNSEIQLQTHDKMSNESKEPSTVPEDAKLKNEKATEHSPIETASVKDIPEINIKNLCDDLKEPNTTQEKTEEGDQASIKVKEAPKIKNPDKQNELKCQEQIKTLTNPMKATISNPIDIPIRHRRKDAENKTNVKGVPFIPKSKRQDPTKNSETSEALKLDFPAVNISMDHRLSSDKKDSVNKQTTAKTTSRQFSSSNISTFVTKTPSTQEIKVSRENKPNFNHIKLSDQDSSIQSSFPSSSLTNSFPLQKSLSQITSPKIHGIVLGQSHSSTSNFSMSSNETTSFFSRKTSEKSLTESKSVKSFKEEVQTSYDNKGSVAAALSQNRLKATPPWFSELNSSDRLSPMDRFDRRSSDISCFLQDKEDSDGVNLADEIRKLSAKLLQMSNNNDELTNNEFSLDEESAVSKHIRNDPIRRFLTNHGVGANRRPKYKFSILNRDVPIGSPPPPSNIAYYLTHSVNENSHSAPQSPRSSPEKEHLTSLMKSLEKEDKLRSEENASGGSYLSTSSIKTVEKSTSETKKKVSSFVFHN